MRYAVTEVSAYLTRRHGMLGQMQGTPTEIEHGERLLAQRPLGWKLAVSVWVLVVGLGFVFFSLLWGGRWVPRCPAPGGCGSGRSSGA